MKIQELKENQPLEVMETLVHRYLRNPTKTIEEKMIQTIVFTDGKVVNEDKEITKNISSYYIGEEEYPGKVDTLKTKNIYLSDHSYVITFVIAKKWIKYGTMNCWTDVIKNVSIYLSNPKDKKALKIEKKAIKKIEFLNHHILDYFLYLDNFCSKGMEIDGFKTGNLAQNIYTLKNESA